MPAINEQQRRLLTEIAFGRDDQRDPLGLFLTDILTGQAVGTNSKIAANNAASGKAGDLLTRFIQQQQSTLAPFMEANPLAGQTNRFGHEHAAMIPRRSAEFQAAQQQHNQAVLSHADQIRPRNYITQQALLPDAGQALSVLGQAGINPGQLQGIPGAGFLSSGHPPAAAPDAVTPGRSPQAHSQDPQHQSFDAQAQSTRPPSSGSSSARGFLDRWMRARFGR